MIPSKAEWTLQMKNDPLGPFDHAETALPVECCGSVYIELLKKDFSNEKGLGVGYDVGCIIALE